MEHYMLIQYAKENPTALKDVDIICKFLKKSPNMFKNFIIYNKGKKKTI